MTQYDQSEADALERMIRWMGATPISTLEKHRSSILIANKCVRRGRMGEGVVVCA